MGLLPFDESRYYFAGHGGIERIELLGPIQFYGTNAVERIEKDIIRVVAGYFFGYVRIFRNHLTFNFDVSDTVSQLQLGGHELLHTLADWPAIAGLRILAFRGMTVDRDRESQLSGCAARVQQDRNNINGSGVVIIVALEWGNFSEL